MRTSRIRIHVAALIFLLLPATAGVLVIHASASCERFVKTYITKPVRNRLSKQTADAWAAWREAHPDWRPNPKHLRPKYVMTREEAIKKVDFACAVEPDVASLKMNIEPEDEPPIQVAMPAMSSELRIPSTTLPEATELAELTPISDQIPFAPLAIPLAGPGPVPEPDTLLLTLSGAAFVGLLVAMRALLPQM